MPAGVEQHRTVPAGFARKLRDGVRRVVRDARATGRRGRRPLARTQRHGGRRAWPLADDRARVAVGFEAEEDRRAQMLARAPLGELHPRHQLGPQPHVARDAELGVGGERRLLHAQRLHPFVQIIQRRLVEARADPGREAQRVVVVIADEQRAERRGPRPRPRTVAADDHLLRLRRLDLEPRGPTAARLVDAVHALGHDAFESEPCRRGVERLAAVHGVLDGPYHVAGGQHAGEQVLALRERRSAHVVAVEIQQVEGVVHQHAGGAGRPFHLRPAHAPLH